jgi:hypothetical protein
MPEIPVTQKEEIGKITVLGQPGRTRRQVSKTSISISQMWWHVPLIPAK